MKIGRFVGTGAMIGWFLRLYLGREKIWSIRQEVGNETDCGREIGLGFGSVYSGSATRFGELVGKARGFALRDTGGGIGDGEKMSPSEEKFPRRAEGRSSRPLFGSFLFVMAE